MRPPQMRHHIRSLDCSTQQTLSAPWQPSSSSRGPRQHRSTGLVYSPTFGLNLCSWIYHTWIPWDNFFWKMHQSNRVFLNELTNVMSINFSVKSNHPPFYHSASSGLALRKDYLRVKIDDSAVKRYAVCKGSTWTKYIGTVLSTFDLL